jgi:malonate transporter and related proteins
MNVDALASFAHLASLTAPLFLLVFVGYALSRWGRWPKVASDALTRFVFVVAIPAFLFRLMSDFSRLYVLARVVGARAFRMDGAQQSIFAVGTIFSNNVLLGIPLAKITLGDASLPAVSMVLIFNSFVLWTLVTVSIEWARNRDFSLRGIARTARDVVTNPVVAGILLGTVFGFTGLALPGMVDETLALVSQAAVPMSLIVLGMGLAEYGIRDEWRASVALTALKLAALPLFVYAVARALALPLRETQAVVMMASLPVGANVYLMARQFGTLEGPVASSLVLSTLLAAATTPLILTLVH